MRLTQFPYISSLLTQRKFTSANSPFLTRKEQSTEQKDARPRVRDAPREGHESAQPGNGLQPRGPTGRPGPLPPQPAWEEPAPYPAEHPWQETQQTYPWAEVPRASSTEKRCPPPGAGRQRRQDPAQPWGRPEPRVLTHDAAPPGSPGSFLPGGLDKGRQARRGAQRGEDMGRRAEGREGAARGRHARCRARHQNASYRDRYFLKMDVQERQRIENSCSFSLLPAVKAMADQKQVSKFSRAGRGPGQEGCWAGAHLPSGLHPPILPQHRSGERGRRPYWSDLQERHEASPSG